ncbi:glycosyltransferase family 2 protein [Neptuniibacter sp. CAU 1671]|uniref:glycosyltransferase family 2 protein n=1 Tax=Neptuniibacter sp. CAU 1671 TaxID=3032593 RepID=UPI0023DA32F1|nr:glycosyltransferase family 2 protein [Neptuniibacter sp. CAU 1671]MDF2181403.1 glycosyltransferase family 2 protein [Neptuniibacter sp. CAU 1671]
MFDISVVSHGQARLVSMLLSDLHKLNSFQGVVLLTENIPDSTAEFSGFAVQTDVISNPAPKGFGANHNQAVRHLNADFVVIMNPDIRLPSEFDFNLLLEHFVVSDIAVVAPRVLSSNGQLEDSSRKFPTVFDIILKVFGLGEGGVQSSDDNRPREVDWVAGMFMLLRKDVFESIGGFDEGFFLYYEDVDLCARLRLAGWKVMLEPRVTVIHDAQRQSHRSFKYLKWHISSLARYFYKFGFLGPKIQRGYK